VMFAPRHHFADFRDTPARCATPCELQPFDLLEEGRDFGFRNRVTRYSGQYDVTARREIFEPATPYYKRRKRHFPSS
jgi:hypothetical protein